MTEDETAGWYYWVHGHEFEQAPGDGEGQRSLACCSSWGSQRAGHNWVTEQQLSICLLIYYFHFISSDIWLVCIKKKKLTLSILYMTTNHKVKLFMIISIRKVWTATYLSHNFKLLNIFNRKNYFTNNLKSKYICDFKTHNVIFVLKVTALKEFKQKYSPKCFVILKMKHSPSELLTKCNRKKQRCQRKLKEFRQSRKTAWPVSPIPYIFKQ